MSDLVYPLITFIGENTGPPKTEEHRARRQSLFEEWRGLGRQEHTFFVEAGLFNPEILDAYMRSYAARKNCVVPLGFPDHVLQRLQYFGLAEPIRLPGFSVPLFQFLTKNLGVTVPTANLHDMIFGLPHAVETVAKQTFRISVESADGAGAGTAFLTSKAHENHTFLFLATNKHVVDPRKYRITEITGRHGKQLAANDVKAIHCSDVHDLAVLTLGIYDSDKLFGLAIADRDVGFLEKIITVGYPDVAHTIDRDLLVHSGEVNGYVKHYDGQRSMIISADVAPGNSGCPVTNELGVVVGVVTQDLERFRASEGATSTGQQNSIIYSSTHHSAVPAEYITKLIDETLAALLSNT